MTNDTNLLSVHTVDKSLVTVFTSGMNTNQMSSTLNYSNMLHDYIRAITSVRANHLPPAAVYL